MKISIVPIAVTVAIAFLSAAIYIETYRDGPTYVSITDDEFLSRCAAHSFDPAQCLHFRFGMSNTPDVCVASHFELAQCKFFTDSFNRSMSTHDFIAACEGVGFTEAQCVFFRTSK